MCFLESIEKPVRRPCMLKEEWRTSDVDMHPIVGRSHLATRTMGSPGTKRHGTRSGVEGWSEIG